MAWQDDRELFRKFGFETREHVSAREPRRLEVAGAAQGRAESAAFMPAGSDQIAGFDFDVHRTEKRIDRDTGPERAEVQQATKV